jgi:uncharacterized protein (TIGR02001 family)
MGAWLKFTDTVRFMRPAGWVQPDDGAFFLAGRTGWCMARKLQRSSRTTHPATVRILTMKITLAALTALVAVSACPLAALAEDAPSTTFNIAAVTDYRYRGISQSGLKPALSAGADYSNPNGIYLGVWASTIRWIKDGGRIAGVDSGNTPLEIDLYGGYKGEIAKDLSYDVGGLYYLYASNKYANIPGAANANTFELYGALTFNVVTAKYSRAFTDTFGNGNSKGSYYLDLSATFDLGNGFSLVPHVGRQGIAHTSAANYTDYSLTLGKDLGNGFSVSAAAIGTNASNTFYVTPDNKFTGKSALVLGAKYSF